MVGTARTPAPARSSNPTDLLLPSAILSPSFAAASHCRCPFLRLGRAPVEVGLRSRLRHVGAAFLVGRTDASLVGILCGASCNFPAGRSLEQSPNIGVIPRSPAVPAIQLEPLQRLNPRAPPVFVAVVS